MKEYKTFNEAYEATIKHFKSLGHSGDIGVRVHNFDRNDSKEYIEFYSKDNSKDTFKVTILP